MSGPSRGLQDWAAEHFPADSPKRHERYVLGDVNVSLIKTANGRTIVVEHCTNLPRPYSRIHMVQGTKGLFQGYPNRVYIEGRGKEDEWQRGAGPARRVRASAVEGDCRARAGRRPRRDGLHRGLPADQVPARRHADRHERLRRGRAQRRRRAERAVERQAQCAGRLAGLHARPLEDEPAARASSGCDAGATGAVILAARPWPPDADRRSTGGPATTGSGRRPKRG